MKKRVTILVGSILIVLLVLSTTTYALFFKQDKLENSEAYTAGILDIVLENDEEGLGEVLKLANSLPITDEEGKKSKPYKFKITNKGNLSYTFDLKMLSTTMSNEIDSRYIKVMIDENKPVALSSLASSIIASNLTLNPGESKIISVRLWLDEYTPNSQIGKVFSAKIVGDGKAIEHVDPSLKTLTKLGLTAKEGTPDFSKTSPQNEIIVNSKYGNYTNVVNDTNYPFTYNSTDKTYTSTNKTNSATGTITFSPGESKKLGLCYTVSSESGWDKATFYLDNVQKAQVSGEESNCIDLGTVGPTNTIKVTYSKDGSGASGSDNVIFYLTDNYTVNSDTGLYETEDDYGKSYYFRGAPTNNYVKFANNFWRVIRINGDGTIRMIYDGTTAHNNGESSTDRQIGKSVFNSSYNDNAYVGYMYGSTGASTYATTHANTNNSTIKTTVDNWYKTNIEDAGYSDKIADVIYCNDRQIASDDYSDIDFGKLGYGIEPTVYAPISRMFDTYISPLETPTPKLTCSQQNDAFTVEDTTKGNGALTYPVGLITMDEVSMAGGTVTSNNSSYYLYTGNYYWNMSPYDFLSGYASVFGVYSNGGLYGYDVRDECGVRPVVSLKSDIQLSGTGSKEDPFTVQ